MKKSITQLPDDVSTAGLLEAVLDGNQDLIYLLDTESRMVLANQATVEFFDLPLAALTKPASRQSLFTGLPAWQDMPDATSQQHEITQHDRNGQAHCFLVSRFLVHSEQGKLIGLCHIAHDITNRKLMQFAIEQERMLFHKAIESAPIALLMADKNGIIEICNASMENMFGYLRSELIGQSVEMLLPETLHQAHIQHRETFMTHPEPRKMGDGRDLTAITRDGRSLIVEVGLAPIQTDKGTSVIASIADVSERHSQMHELYQRELRYRSVIETTPDGFWVVDGNSQQLKVVNPAYCRMSGYSEDELRNMTVSQLDAIELEEDTRNHIEQVSRQGFDRFETWHRRKDGSYWPAEVTVSMVAELNELFVFIRDLTELKNLEEQRVNAMQEVSRLAYHDPLTQLPNRRALVERLEQAMSSARRQQRHGGLFFIDLDHFKQLNDSHGHKAGDMLLVQVALRLAAHIRAEDFVARFGGDEFILLVNDLDEDATIASQQCELMGDKLLQVLNEPYMLESHDWLISPSIGITLFMNDNDCDEVIRRADNAMYRAKSSGKNQHAFIRI